MNRSTGASDGLNVSWRWLAGICAALLVALVGGWAGTVQLRLTAIETALSRISAVEAHVALLQSQYREFREVQREILAALEAVKKEISQHRIAHGEVSEPRRR